MSAPSQSSNFESARLDCRFQRPKVILGFSLSKI